MEGLSVGVPRSAWRPWRHRCAQGASDYQLHVEAWLLSRRKGERCGNTGGAAQPSRNAGQVAELPGSLTAGIPSPSATLGTAGARRNDRLGTQVSDGCLDAGRTDLMRGVEGQAVVRGEIAQ